MCALQYKQREWEAEWGEDLASVAIIEAVSLVLMRWFREVGTVDTYIKLAPVLRVISDFQPEVCCSVPSQFFFQSFFCLPKLFV